MNNNLLTQRALKTEDRRQRTEDRSWLKRTLIKSFCRGSRGAVFSKRAPLAAGGRRINNE